MWKKHKVAVIGLLLLAVVLAAGVTSYALAQSSGGSQTTASGNVISRHVDYNVNLQVSGDLSTVNPKLQGVLPLNLSAQGGADVQKSDNGPQVQGNLQLNGLDGIIQKLSARGGSGLQGSLGGTLAKSILSNLQFIAVDHDLYLNLGGAWYDTGDLTQVKRPGNRRDNGSGTAEAQGKACLQGAFPGGAKALLTNVQQSPDTVDGVATTHYTASTDLDKALTEAAAAATNCGKTAEAAKLTAAKGQIESATKQLNLEWWIDGGNQVRQVKVDVDVNPSALAPVLEADAPQGKAARVDAILKGITDVKLDAQVKFSQFGQDFQIQKPSGDVQPLKNLMGLLGHHKRGDQGAPATMQQ